MLLRQTPPGKPNDLLKSESIREQTGSDKKSLEVQGRSKAFPGAVKLPALKILQNPDGSTLSKQLENSELSAAQVSCQTTQQVSTHLNREEPDELESPHKEFHSAVIKALSSNPDLLAEASGINEYGTAVLPIKGESSLSLNLHLWNLYLWTSLVCEQRG